MKKLLKFIGLFFLIVLILFICICLTKLSFMKSEFKKATSFQTHQVNISYSDKAITHQLVKQKSPYLSFDGKSSDLDQTIIAATLDTNLKDGKNIIWSASFLACWKILQNDIVEEPVDINKNIEIISSLNKSFDPRPYIPDTNLYTAHGLLSNDLISKINSELFTKFPEKQLPKYELFGENNYLIYSYMEAIINFPYQYYQNDEPLSFIDRKGNETKVISFGIKIVNNDTEKLKNIRKQVDIIFNTPTSYKNSLPDEFIIDLCKASSPNQIILASINKEESLAKFVERIEKEISDSKNISHENELTVLDELLVPNFDWKISHNYKKIEGGVIKNKKLLGNNIFSAKQDIKFRLGKDGVALKSESSIEWGGFPRSFIFSKPFLIYMKKRGGKKPFFVMWVENSELLQKYN